MSSRGLPPPAFWLARAPAGWRLLPPEHGEGFRGQYDSRGRARVYIGKRHPWAQASGQCWLSRFIVHEALAEHWRQQAAPASPESFPFGDNLRYDGLDPLLYPLSTMDHVHHVNGSRVDDDAANYEVLAASYHNALHAESFCTHRRGPDGRFAPLAQPDWPPRPAPRFGAIIGPAALRAA